jgi:hypothetical protein
LKFIKDLNVRVNTTKLLEENIVMNLYELGLGNDFFKKKKRSSSNKIHINWTSKLKTCASTDPIKKGKNNPKNGRKCLQIVDIMKHFYLQSSKMATIQ